MGFIKNYLAIDLGAESGRGIIGTLADDRIELSEIHRFTTGPTKLPTKYPHQFQNRDDNSLVWDFIRFWQEIKSTIHQAAQDRDLSSLGVDTWGVDFAILDENGGLISSPYHYRDNRTDGMMEKAFERLSKERIYEITGIQFMPLNTIFQLLSLAINDSPSLRIADKLLMIPDLINYWLTGQAVAEFTAATTSQIYDTPHRHWSQEIINALGFPGHIFPKVIEPGTVLGKLRPSLVQELNCDLTVVAPATHDTGSAVAAIPADEEDYIWISSGTWSIIGMNTPAPIINEQSFLCNFTNEGGRSGTNRFCTNMIGMWVIQQLRDQWHKEGCDFSYTELTKMAENAPPMKTIIDPNYSEFLKVGDIVEKIINYCRLTQQPIPENTGAMVRAVLQGLALRYRFVIEQLEEIVGKQATAIHIVGGGSKNKLMNQFTADALGRKVITGPVEATATGNILLQSITMGDVANFQEGVALVKNSFEIETFEPGEPQGWDKAYALFNENLEKITLAF